MSNPTSAALRRQLAAHLVQIEARPREPPADPAAGGVFGVAVLDAALVAGGLHEIHAGSEADVAALTGFVLAVAHRLAAGRPIVWVRQDFADGEGGRVHAPGLAEIGVEPSVVTLVGVRDVAGLLQAGLDAARCRTIGTVVLELWGETRALDLTAGRRLLLAARGSGATVLLARVAPPSERRSPQPSAAETRWRVCAAPSRPAPANAPGPPAFLVELSRRRGGVADLERCVEWNRDRSRFEERPAPVGASLSRPVVSLPADRSAATEPADEGLRHTG